MALFRREPDQELRQLLERVTEERAALDQWLELIDSAGARLDDQRERASELDARVAVISSSVANLDELNKRVDQVHSRLDRVERKQGETEERADAAGRRVAEADASVTTLSTSLKEATSLRAELDALVKPGGPIGEMRRDGDALREQFLNFQHDVLHVRDTLDSLRQVRDTALGDFATVREEVLRVKDTTVETEMRLEDMARIVRDAKDIETQTAQNRRDLEALSALADRTAQKTAGLEAQRELVDRVGAQSTRLTDLAWDLDARIKKMDERSREWKKAEQRAEEIRELLGRVEAEASKADGLWQDASTTTQRAGEQLDTFRRRLDEALARLGTERGDIETVTRRLTDLRTDVGEMEQRLEGLGEADRRAREAQGRADDVSQQVVALGAEFTRLQTLGERALAADAVVERITREAATLDDRLVGLAARAASLEGLRAEIERLSGAQGAVEDATGRLTAARSELDRAVETVGSTRTELATLRTRFEAAEQQGAALNQLEPELTRTARLAERVLGQLDATVQREQFVREMQGRLDGLGALSAEVAERQHVFETGRAALTDAERRLETLVERLGDVDRQFAAAAARGREADAVADRLATVEAGVGTATEHLATLDSDLEATRRRHGEITALAERAEQLGRQIAERERSLEATIGQLDQVGALRAEAFSTVGDVAEHVRRLEAATHAADEQTGRLTHMAAELESRAGHFRFVEKRLTQFEEKLAELSRAEDRLVGLVADWRQREETLEAFSADVERMRAAAERTRSDLAAIAEAQDGVEATRRRLDEVLRRAGESEQLAASLETRVARLAEVESSVARVDGLLADARVGLETLRTERATLEFLVEKAGKLGSESRQAEALIAALKDERDRVQRVAEGLRELRDERAG